MVNKKNYKAVIFDLGDVYYRNGFRKALVDLCKKKGLVWKYLDEVFEKKYIKDVEIDKIKEKEFWKRFDKDIPIEIDDVSFRKKVFSYFKPNPGMKKLVADLRKKNKVGLLTNNLKVWFNRNNKKGKISKNFDAVVVSARVGLRKPQRKIYQLMAKRLKVKLPECIFFDDMRRNVDGAKKNGMTAYQFKSAEDCRKKLKKLRVL